VKNPKKGGMANFRLGEESLKFAIPRIAQQIWEGEYSFNKTKAHNNNQGKIAWCSKAM
jgi:hypothetical protein